MALTYKYSLDNSSIKFICPNCRRKTFVRYRDNETGNYLPDIYGKCDRALNCNHHKAPPRGNKAYLINFKSIVSISEMAYKLIDADAMVHIVPKSQVLEIGSEGCYISQWYLSRNKIQYLGNGFKYFDSPKIEYVNKELSVSPIKKDPTYHRLELLDELYCEKHIEDNFVKYLKSKYSSEQVNKCLLDYYITGTDLVWDGSTILWQIDNEERIHAGKIMLYNVKTGKRVKDPCDHVRWVHSTLKLPGFNLEQCLFGLHKIIDEPQRTIAIVEGESTALEYSILLPDFIWMATGGKGNLNERRLKPIKNRNIVLYPDKSEYENWNKKALEFKANGYKITVSDFIEKTDLPKGSDLRDYIMN